MYELFFNQFSDNLLVNVVSSESPVAKDLVQDYKNHGQEYLFGGQPGPTLPPQALRPKVTFYCIFFAFLKYF